MTTFLGDTSNRTHGSNMRSIFDSSTKNITQKNYNENRQVKNLLAIKEKVLASNFIENKDVEISSDSYVPSLIKIPNELRDDEYSNAICPEYEGDNLSISKFQQWQDSLKKLWDKPIVKLSVSFLAGLIGIVAASAFIKRSMAQKIGSKLKNFNEIKTQLDTQISNNLDDVAKHLEKIADKLIHTANQDLAGNTQKYQQLVEFSQQFKAAANQTRTGKMPDKLELLFVTLKDHLKTLYSNKELKALTPELRKVAEQFKTSQQLPAFARNININNDLHATIINAIQDPTNVKNTQALFAVLGISSLGAIGKRFVDGLCEIWVRQKEANIQRDLQEAMIAIETRAFSGKNHILRNMIADKAKNLKDMADNNWKRNYQILRNFMDNQQNLNNKTATGISFTGSEVFNNFHEFNESFRGDLERVKREKEDSKNKKVLFALLGIGGLLTVAGLYVVLKNIAKTAKLADAAKEEVIKRTKFMSDDVIEILQKDTPFSLQDAVFGNPTKIGIASYVEGVTGFLYTFIMNKTPETLLAFFSIVGATGGGYVGTKLLDSIKDVEVKRVNAETERRLQERLVEVELKNFMAKKNSLIKPLVDEYKVMVKRNEPNTALNRQYNMILDELKNGPPFIYA